jgi:methylenetetrahydrofolate reductase (NADPH)
MDADLDILKAKLDAGASRAITQYFFDVEHYERYLEKARARGITAPIVPGILPVTNFGQLVKFSAACGASVPDWLFKLFDGLDQDPETRKLVAATVATAQVQKLRALGVEEFHFYTLNRAELVLAICRHLGIRAQPGEAPKAA